MELCYRVFRKRYNFFSKFLSILKTSSVDRFCRKIFIFIDEDPVANSSDKIFNFYTTLNWKDFRMLKVYSDVDLFSRYLTTSDTGLAWI